MRDNHLGIKRDNVVKFPGISTGEVTRERVKKVYFEYLESVRNTATHINATARKLEIRNFLIKEKGIDESVVDELLEQNTDTISMEYEGIINGLLELVENKESHGI